MLGPKNDKQSRILCFILALGLLAGVVFLTLARIPSITRKEIDMSTNNPTEAHKQSEQPSLSPSDNMDERIAQIENGLVTMSVNGQLQWGSAFKLAERMEFYHMMYRHTTPACHW